MDSFSGFLLDGHPFGGVLEGGVEELEDGGRGAGGAKVEGFGRQRDSMVARGGRTGSHPTATGHRRRRCCRLVRMTMVDCHRD